MNSLRQYLARLSIKSKLFLIIFAVCLPTVCMVVAAISYFSIDQTRKQIKENLEVTTRITSEQLSAALAFDDKETGNQILESLAHNKSVKRACVYNSNNSLFLEFQSKNGEHGVACSQFLGNTINTEKQDTLLFQAPIRQGKIVNLGQILIFAKFDSLTNIIAAKMLFVFISLIVVLVFISVPLAHILQSKISKPVLSLYEQGKALTSLSNTQTENPKNKDELSLTIQAIEQIKSHIHVYYEAIENVETVLTNHSHFLELVQKSFKRRREIHKNITHKIDFSNYSQMVEVAEHSLGLQTVLDMEDSELLDLLNFLYAKQVTIMREETKISLSQTSFENLLFETLSKKNLSSNHITLQVHTPLEIRVYETALCETITALSEFFEAFILSANSYQMNVYTSEESSSKIFAELECLTKDPDIPNFDLENVKVEIALIKMQHFMNINNPHLLALETQYLDDKITVSLRF